MIKLTYLHELGILICTILRVDMSLMCSSLEGNFCPPTPLRIHVYIITIVVLHFPICTSAIMEEISQWHF
jgi:hypothetical protein